MTAAPRFINLSSDANAAALDAIGAQLLSAGNLARQKAFIRGMDESAEEVDIALNSDGSLVVSMRYGYVSGKRDNGITSLMGDTFQDDFAWSSNTGNYAASNLRVMQTKHTSDGEAGQLVNLLTLARRCYVEYRPAQAEGEKASYVIVDDEC